MPAGCASPEVPAPPCCVRRANGRPAERPDPAETGRPAPEPADLAERCQPERLWLSPGGALPAALRCVPQLSATSTGGMRLPPAGLILFVAVPAATAVPLALR